MHKNDCVIYVASWDGYSDLWDPFFELFWKHWPDCPYPVYLGCNSKQFNDPRVNMLYAGTHDNWTDRTREHLAVVDAKFVLMMLDDWYLISAVNTKEIIELVELMRKLDGRMLRLVTDPKPDTALAGHPKIGLLKTGKLNRTNTHATIWDRDTLLKLMRNGESLWQFEVNGSIRSNVFSGGIYSVWKTAIKYIGAVDAGKWTRRAASTLKEFHIECNLEARGVKTVQETYKHHVLNALATILRKVTSLRFRQAAKMLLGGSDTYRKHR